MKLFCLLHKTLVQLQSHAFYCMNDKSDFWGEKLNGKEHVVFADSAQDSQIENISANVLICLCVSQNLNVSRA